MTGFLTEDINWELKNGAKFAVFQYCISILVMRFRRNSDIYFIKAVESITKHSIEFTLLAFFAGWWGIPLDPIYSVDSLYTILVAVKILLRGSKIIKL